VEAFVMRVVDVERRECVLEKDSMTGCLTDE
jgi:hypothetical protein